MQRKRIKGKEEMVIQKTKIRLHITNYICDQNSGNISLKYMELSIVTAMENYDSNFYF
jgi:hypothetical protein